MKELVAKLEALLRLRSIPFGMKLYESAAEMEAIPKIRRPKGSVHTLDQIVAQAARLGWTVGITTEDLVGDQCRSVVGLGGQDEKWFSGQHMTGVWFATQVDASAHQKAMNLVPAGKFKALAVAPLASGRIDAPDIALFYATPGAMMYFINGLQWSGYKRFDWSVVGESACAELHMGSKQETLCGAQQNFRQSVRMNLVPGWQRVIQLDNVSLRVEGSGIRLPAGAGVQ